MVQKEELLKVSAVSTLSSTTSTTEYFSAISSDDDDDFFDIQTDTERESEAEDAKSAQVGAQVVVYRTTDPKFLRSYPFHSMR